MVMPIGDENRPGARIPYVTYALIAANVLVFLLQLSMGERFTYAYSTVPKEITTGEDITGPRQVRVSGLQGAEEVTIEHEVGPRPIYLTLLSSMFMHGGWLHLLGNMLFLWIFGDNIEDTIGHVRFALYYLLCGLAASAAHIATDPDSIIPSLGASGAISGVMGGYIVMFPRNPVRVLFGRVITTMPALLVLGLWIGLQLLSAFTDQKSGVAFWAHIGGFAAGVALIYPFRMGVAPKAPARPRDRWDQYR
jgi:membrane associated rhomboid family serine protease